MSIATANCCDEWAHAQQGGTDSEGYSALLRQIGGHWFMGSYSDLRAVKFCPWCGSQKTCPTPLEAAAKRVVDLFYGPERGEWDDLKHAIAELGEHV